MSAASHKKDALKCGICQHPYDTKKRRPFTPSTCSHTACAACFCDLVLRSGQGGVTGEGNEGDIPGGCVITCPQCQVDVNTSNITVNKELLGKVRQKHLDDLPVIDELIISDLVPPEPSKNISPSAPVQNIMDEPLQPMPEPTTQPSHPQQSQVTSVQGPQPTSAHLQPQPGFQQPQPPMPFQGPPPSPQGGQYPYPQPQHHPQPHQSTTPFQQPPLPHNPHPPTGGPGIGWSKPGSMPSHTLKELSHQGHPPPNHPPGTPSPMGWTMNPNPGGHGAHVEPGITAVGVPVAHAHEKKKKHKKDKKKKKEKGRSSSSSSSSRSSSPDSSPGHQAHKPRSRSSSSDSSGKHHTRKHGSSGKHHAHKPHAHKHHSHSKSSGSSRSPPRHRHSHKHKRKSSGSGSS